jgi:hypothetical protein
MKIVNATAYDTRALRRVFCAVHRHIARYEGALSLSGMALCALSLDDSCMRSEMGLDMELVADRPVHRPMGPKQRGRREPRCCTP